MSGLRDQANWVGQVACWATSLENVPPTQKLLLIAIAREGAGLRAFAPAPLACLTQRTGTHVSTVSRNLRRLVDAGFLEVRRSSDVAGSPYEYRIVFGKESPAVRLASGSDQVGVLPRGRRKSEKVGRRVEHAGLRKRASRWWDRIRTADRRLAAQPSWGRGLLALLAKRLEEFPRLFEELPRRLLPIAGWVRGRLTLEALLRKRSTLASVLRGDWRVVDWVSPEVRQQLEEREAAERRRDEEARRQRRAWARSAPPQEVAREAIARCRAALA